MTSALYLFYFLAVCAKTALRFSCLTGLPIMGGILNRQSETGTDFSGLQLFSSLTALLGAGGLMVSTHLLARSHGTWKV